MCVCAVHEFLEARIHMKTTVVHKTKSRRDPHAHTHTQAQSNETREAMERNVKRTAEMETHKEHKTIFIY